MHANEMNLAAGPDGALSWDQGPIVDVHSRRSIGYMKLFYPIFRAARPEVCTMRIILAALLMLMVIPAWAKWVAVTESGSTIYYIDPRHITKDGDLRRLFLLEKRRSPARAVSCLARRRSSSTARAGPPGPVRSAPTPATWPAARCSTPTAATKNRTRSKPTASRDAFSNAPALSRPGAPRSAILRRCLPRLADRAAT